MRWIFFSLIIINLAAFLWFWQSGRVVAQVDQAGAVSLDGAGQGGRKLVLLKELERRQIQQRPGKPLSRLGKTGDSLCTLVGPFKELIKGEFMVERLRSLDINTRLQELEIPGEPGYWVYLPPEPSRKQALRRLHELQAKGVDSYVIPKGDLANGISFGMFSQRELADARLAQMQEQGYKARLREVKRSYKEIWVIFRPAEARKLSDMLWQTLQEDYPEQKRRQNYCPPVAS